MSAADSIKQAPAAPDQKLYEPSMEEILASIRRIIADDQSLPGRISTNEEEERLRAILTPEAAPAGPEATPARDPAPTVRAIFAPHPVAAPSASSQPMASPLAAREPLSAQPRPATTSPAAPVPAAASPEPGAPESAPIPPAPAAGVPPEVRIAAPQYAMPDAPVAPRPAAASGPPAATPPADVPRPDEAGELRHSLARAADRGESLFSPGTGSSVTAAFNTLAATRLIDNDAALQDLAREMLRPMLKDWLDDNLPVMVERLVRAEIERVGRSGR